MRRTLIPMALAAVGISVAHAQTSPSASTVITSTPGKAEMVSVVDLAATVVAIDKGTRTVTLKGAQGRTVDIVCSEEVRNFDQIRVGDQVTARYRESLKPRIGFYATGFPLEPM